MFGSSLKWYKTDIPNNRQSRCAPDGNISSSRFQLFRHLQCASSPRGEPLGDAHKLRQALLPACDALRARHICVGTTGDCARFHTAFSRSSPERSLVRSTCFRLSPMGLIRCKAKRNHRPTTGFATKLARKILPVAVIGLSGS